MQITIENNITNILFYPATEIKLYRHQMRTLSGRKGNYKFLQFKNVLFFLSSEVFAVLIVEILNFIAYVDGHGFSGVVRWYRCCFFSGDYHFCILLSDSLSEFMQFSPGQSLNPCYRLAFQFFRANFFAISTVNCQFTDFFDVSVTICWLPTWLCNFSVFWNIQVTWMQN